MKLLDKKFMKLLSNTLLSFAISAFGYGTSCSFAATTPPVSTNANLMGINIAAPLDYEEDRLYADVIRTSRDFKAGENENSNTLVEVDSNGWPMADFSFYTWGSLANRHGRYTLTFKGQATVTSNPRLRIPLSYDAATNTSTATFNYTNTGKAAFALRFTDTKRSRNSASGTGVTSIKLMQPLTPGATQSYPSTTLFTTPIKALISKFSVIRFMDFLATNSNQQKTWGERPLPAWASFNRYASAKSPASADKYGWQGIGGPLEHAILLANETNKDAWINIPVLADDAYITNVAKLLAFGSDGINPYNSAQPKTVFPPLNANLNVYIEYSNELWNSAGAFSQTYTNCQLASDELARTNGASPLNWDGQWHGNTYKGTSTVPWSPTNRGGWDYSMCFRRPAKRIVEISNIFRSVFGDSAMMTRVRPVMMTQLSRSAIIYEQSKMLLNYYNHMAGDFADAPPARPPAYYIYASGGSAYYDPKDPGVASVDAFFSDPGMLPPGYIGKWGSTGFRPSLQTEAKYMAALGVKRIAYEGGPNLETGVNVKNYTITESAANDPRMTATMINMHNEWSANNGDLLVYYRATGDYQWGFTTSIFNLETYKLAAIDALNINERAPLTLGTPVPGSLAGSAADICSRGWGCSPISGNDYFTADGSKIIWASYSFRSLNTNSWTINLSFKNASNDATVAVYIDGKLLATKQIAGEALSFKTEKVGAGLHGVIVRAATGKFSLNNISVAQN